MKLKIITLFLSILPFMKSYDSNYDYDVEVDYGARIVYCNYENSCLGTCTAYRYGTINQEEANRLGSVEDKQDMGALIVFDWSSDASEKGANINAICSDDDYNVLFTFTTEDTCLIYLNDLANLGKITKESINYYYFPGENYFKFQLPFLLNYTEKSFPFHIFSTNLAGIFHVLHHEKRNYQFIITTKDNKPLNGTLLDGNKDPLPLNTLVPKGSDNKYPFFYISKGLPDFLYFTLINCKENKNFTVFRYFYACKSYSEKTINETKQIECDFGNVEREYIDYATACYTKESGECLYTDVEGKFYIGDEVYIFHKYNRIIYRKKWELCMIMYHNHVRENEGKYFKDGFGIMIYPKGQEDQYQMFNFSDHNGGNVTDLNTVCGEKVPTVEDKNLVLYGYFQKPIQISISELVGVHSAPFYFYFKVIGNGNVKNGASTVSLNTKISEVSGTTFTYTSTENILESNVEIDYKYENEVLSNIKIKIKMLPDFCDNSEVYYTSKICKISKTQNQIIETISDNYDLLNTFSTLKVKGENSDFTFLNIINQECVNLLKSENPDENNKIIEVKVTTNENKEYIYFGQVSKTTLDSSNCSPAVEPEPEEEPEPQEESEPEEESETEPTPSPQPDPQPQPQPSPQPEPQPSPVSQPDNKIEYTPLVKAAYKLGYNLEDIKSPFYNDICVVFSFENDDIVLRDRKTYVYNVVTQCKEKCDNYENKDLHSSIFSEFNIKPMKCYNLFKKSSLITKSSGLWLSTLVLGIQIACFAYFNFIEFIPFVQNISDIIKPNIVKRIVTNAESNPNLKGTIETNDNETIPTPTLNTHERTGTNNVLFSYQTKNFIHKNDYSFIQALEKDDRNFTNILKSFLLDKILIIKIFKKREFEFYSVNCSLFLINLSLLSVFNSCFFSNSMISQKYHNNLSFSNILYKSFISSIFTSIICVIINILMTYVQGLNSLLSSPFIDNPKVLSSLKSIGLKHKIYYSCIIGINTLFWYYLSLFAAVYNESQGNWILSIFLSLILSNLLKGFVCVLMTCLRYFSLKKQIEILFGIQNILNKYI